MVVQVGSVSIRLAGRVRLKLVPTGPGGAEIVRLGIAAMEQPQAWCEESLEIGTINAQPFGFVTLSGDRARAIDVAEGIFEHLRARHDKIDA